MGLLESARWSLLCFLPFSLVLYTSRVLGWPHDCFDTTFTLETSPFCVHQKQMLTTLSFATCGGGFYLHQRILDLCMQGCLCVGQVVTPMCLREQVKQRTTLFTRGENIEASTQVQQFPIMPSSLTPCRRVEAAEMKRSSVLGFRAFSEQFADHRLRLTILYCYPHISKFAPWFRVETLHLHSPNSLLSRCFSMPSSDYALLQDCLWWPSPT